MPVKLSINHDLKRLERTLKRHEIALSKTAIPQAVNRTIVSVNREALREISETTGLTQKTNREKFRVVKTAKKGKLIALIDAEKGKGRNLINFVRAKAANVEHFRAKTKRGKFKHKGVKARAWRKTKVYKGTFIGRVNGDLKVFKRGSNNKLEYVVGPSARNEFNKRPLRKHMKAHAKKRLNIELTSAISRQIKKKVAL